MLTSIRGLAAATFLAGCAFASAPAAAQDGGIEVSANVGVVSEYRFRGADLSGGDIAIQGGIDVGHDSGFYIGTWGSSLDEDTVGYGHTELNIYGGWSTEFTNGIFFDVGMVGYIFPNSPAGDYDYLEFYSSAGFALGPGTVAVGAAYAPKQDSLGSEDNLYLYADASIGVPNSPISLSGHLGYTDGFLAFTNDTKAFDWSIGLDVALGETLLIGAAYVGAEGDYAPGDYNFTDDAIVFSLTASF